MSSSILSSCSVRKMTGQKINSDQRTKTFNLSCQWGWRRIVYTHDDQTTTNPHNPLYVPHRWYWYLSLTPGTWGLAIVQLLWLVLDTLCFSYSLMLSSHAYYAFEANLLFSNYAENFFRVHRQNISFSMYVHALNEGPCVIINVLPWRRVRG